MGSNYFQKCIYFSKFGFLSDIILYKNAAQLNNFSIHRKDHNVDNGGYLEMVLAGSVCTAHVR